jgi:hypothetical protein
MQARVHTLLAHLEPAVVQVCSSAELVWAASVRRTSLGDFCIPANVQPSGTSYHTLEELDRHPLVVRERVQFPTLVERRCPLAVSLDFVEVIYSKDVQDPATPTIVGDTASRKFKTLSDALLFARAELVAEQKSYVYVYMQWTIEVENYLHTFYVQVIVHFVQAPDYNLNSHLLLCSK